MAPKPRYIAVANCRSLDFEKRRGHQQSCLMPDQTTKELEPEIGQVLFIDTVGFSRLLMDEQLALLETLNRVVRDASHCQPSAAAGKLIRIPTGDGMALVFFDSPEAPAQCALEISRALRDFPHVQVRMGIHSGPVSRVSDVNEGANITGAGINIAQRVMSCADGGHILRIEALRRRSG